MKSQVTRSVQNPEPRRVNATAPGKIILFGEHAVVYNRPAIAVPVFQVHAEAIVASRNDGKVVIEAIDLNRTYDFSEARASDPIAMIIRLACAHLAIEPKDFTVRIHSTIPIGGGLGSGAAVSVAIARAIGKHFSSVIASRPAQTLSRPERIEGESKTRSESKETEKQSHTRLGIASSPPSTRLLAMTDADISALAYEVEKLHHGTPSGIDNTVIAFEKPVYFLKGRVDSLTGAGHPGTETRKDKDARENRIESFRVAQPYTIAIADTGIAAPTKIAVGDVRRAWERNRTEYESLFDEIGEIAREARKAMEGGEVNRLGALMRTNHNLLRRMGVSSPDIERLVLAAMAAGARGAKLSGGGRGGNVIVLVDETTQVGIQRALKKAGAKRVLITEVK